MIANIIHVLIAVVMALVLAAAVLFLIFRYGDDALEKFIRWSKR
jgi:hypothetical protein